MAKKRVLYLVSRENILEPGVLKSQVLDLVGQVVRDSRDTKITVLNLPSINRFFRYIRNYPAVRKYVRDRRIRLAIIPILPIGRSFMPVWAIPFFLIQTVPFVLFFIMKYRINIIHARSYLPALIAWIFKKFGLTAGFIFDVRGLYLQEGLTYRRWGKASFDYRFWKGLERRIFNAADLVVVQSTGLERYVKEVSSRARFQLIPPCVDEQAFRIGAAERGMGRERLGINDRFVLVYSGSLGSFHEPEFLARSYFDIRKFIPKPYFLVLTHSDPELLLRHLRKFRIPEEEYRVLHNPKDLGQILPLGDAGLHLMSDLPITPTAIAVKFGDYLAADLPVVISRNMESVTSLVEGHGCGVVIDRNNSRDVRSKMQRLVKERGTMKKNSLRLARDYFSAKVCARKYLKIYDELIQKVNA